MKRTKKLDWLRDSLLVGVAMGLTCLPAIAQTPKFHVEKTWHIGGNGGWDYLKVDPGAHRLYIARGNRVQVVDIETGKLIGEMGGMGGTHGIVLDSNGKTGYVSDGGDNVVRVFNRATMKVTGKIPAGQGPDGIVFDPATHRVFAFNGHSNSATAIDTNTNSVLKTIALPGRPEFPVSDGQGNIYDNIESKSEIVRIDAHSLKVTATWPLAPCKSPSGLAIDRAHHRLFSVCQNNLMAVVDTRNGHVVATPAIGQGPDAARFDAKLGLAFSSNGRSGTLTVVREISPNHYSSVQTLATMKGARTMALDSRTGTLYLVTAKFGPPQAGAGNHHHWPSVLPGTFVVLVVGKK